MVQAIKEGLSKLIDDIEELRSSTNQQKANLLKGEATPSAANGLAALNRQLKDLRLAQDILDDALTALRRQIKDHDGEQAA
jgi:hypothetical protein